MKLKVIMFIPLFLGAIWVSGQSNKVTSAYYALQDGDLDDAVTYIEPATTHEKTMGKEKTWRYRGAIYMKIYESENEEYKKLVEDPLQLAYESFTKANELDQKGSYIEDNTIQLGLIQAYSRNEGNELYMNADYKGAIAKYDRSIMIASEFGAVDTVAIYNTALAAENIKDHDLAIKSYERCIELGYDSVEVYTSLANEYYDREDTENFLRILKKGQERYPKDQELLRSEINYYLGKGMFDEAEASISQAIEIAPTPILWSALGDIYDGRANPVSGDEPSEEDFQLYSQKAEDAYLKSAEMDPDYFNAYFNLGVTYYNRAAHLSVVIKSITDDKKYMEKKKEVDEMFGAAIPHFERAHEIEPEDQQTIAQLASLYARLNMTDKWEAMKGKMKE